MAQFSWTVDKKRNLTIFSVSGILREDEFIETIDKFYAGEFTLNTLWDFSSADISSFDADQIRRVIFHSKQYLERRAGGKTAYVVSSDFGFAIGRMYDTFTELEESPVLYRVFRDSKEAIEWLEV